MYPYFAPYRANITKGYPEPKKEGGHTIGFHEFEIRQDRHVHKVGAFAGNETFNIISYAIAITIPSPYLTIASH